MHGAASRPQGGTTWVLHRAAQRGASTIEYLMVLGLVALIAVAGVKLFGTSTSQSAKCLGEAVRTLESGAPCTGEGAGDGLAAHHPTTVADNAGSPAAAGSGVWSSVTSTLKACSDGSCLGGDYCFAAGTRVWTADGPRPIETVRAGDLVLSRDPETAAIAFRAVTRTFVTPAREVATLEVSGPDGTTEWLGVTPEHAVWTARSGWRRVRDLDAGELGLSAAGAPVRFASVSSRPQRETVYNLEVEEFHTYFVGEAATWVHNDCPTTAPKVERTDFTGASAVDVLGVLDWWQRLGDKERDQVNAKLAEVAKGGGSKKDYLIKEAKDAISRRKSGDPGDLMRMPRNWQGFKDAQDNAKKIDDAWNQPGGQLRVPLLDFAEAGRARAGRFRPSTDDGGRIPSLKAQMQTFTDTLLGKSGLRDEVKKNPGDLMVRGARDKVLKVIVQREFQVDDDLRVRSKPTRSPDDKLGDFYFDFQTPPSIEVWDPTPQRGGAPPRGIEFPRGPNANGRPLRIPKHSDVGKAVAALEAKVLNGDLTYAEYLAEMVKLGPKIRAEAEADAKIRALQAKALGDKLNNDLLELPETAESSRQQVRQGKNLRKKEEYDGRSALGKVGATFQGFGEAADSALESTAYLLNPLRWTFGTPNTSEKPIWERDFSAIPEAIANLPRAIAEGIEDASYEPDKLLGKIGFEVATIYLPTKASKLITVGDRTLEAVNAVRQAKRLAQAGKVAEAEEMLAIARAAQKDLLELSASSGKKAAGNIARGMDDGVNAAQKAVEAARALQTAEGNQVLKDLARILNKSEAEILKDIETKVGAKLTERGAGRDKVLAALRGERAKFATHILDSVLDENIEAVKQLRKLIKEMGPDAIVGMESGGGFLAEVVARGDADLAGKLVRVPKPPSEFRMPIGGKVAEAAADPDKTLKLLDGTVVKGTIPKLDPVAIHNLIKEGKKKIVIIDSYMGGGSRDNFVKMMKLITDKHPHVKIEMVWLRETFGLEIAEAGKVAMKTPRAIGVADNIVPVRYIVGDDMGRVLPGKTSDALKIFDKDGKILRTATPKPGESSRDALIRLLNEGKLYPAPPAASPGKAAAALNAARAAEQAAEKAKKDADSRRAPGP